MDGAPAHRHRVGLSGCGRAVTVKSARHTWLSVQPPQVHQAGARLPVQVVGMLHVAEPGDGEDALQFQPPLDGSPTLTGCRDPRPGPKKIPGS